jgi:hypothetical protein
VFYLRFVVNEIKQSRENRNIPIFSVSPQSADIVIRRLMTPPLFPMKNRMPDEVEFKTQSGHELLPKDRTILEREFMEFRPFGLDEKGHTIRDLSG